MSGDWKNRMHSFSRRRFLKALSSAAFGSGGSPSTGFSFAGVAAGPASAQATSAPAFEEIPPRSSGITWVHSNGRSPEMYLPETTGAGCAFIDYDNDGWMDIYLVNSGRCDFYDPKPPLRNALYRNNRDGTFTDVTEKAGVGAGGYGQGVAVGDYNADGWPDREATQSGRRIVYRN